MSAMTDAERLIQELRNYAPYARLNGNHLDPTEKDLLDTADALEAALAREQAKESECKDWIEKYGNEHEEKQVAIKEREHIQAELNVAAIELRAARQEANDLGETADKLTEENRVLRKYMRDAEEMLRKPHDPFVMVNAANLLNQGLAETARAEPAGANDELSKRTRT